LQRDQDLLPLILGDVGTIEHLADLRLEHGMKRLVAEGQPVVDRGFIGHIAII
jgi:hypothetical protein